ncbi:hypothetical protein EVAR_98561_1 [Eumeta japonica]|uniref:Uncharacterized protein n=1 Tax=Eumeta variegata TaxID=151549 RepID=A0A4C1YH62_EUMVA|nr:hypothetical protein EVAR_98561_1 [Eumeta japonica]
MILKPYFLNYYAKTRGQEENSRRRTAFNDPRPAGYLARAADAARRRNAGCEFPDNDQLSRLYNNWNQERGQNRKPEPQPKLRMGSESKPCVGLGLESKTWSGLKSRAVPEPESKTGTTLGFSALSFHIKDEGKHSMSTRARPRTENGLADDRDVVANA